MKQLAAIILLQIVFIQTFNRFALEADYFINKNYVSKNLCENKDKPALNCCGKCFLKKQLKKQDKQDQSANTKKNSSEIQLYYVANNPHNPGKKLVSKTKYFVLDNSYLCYLPRAIFRPPSA